MTRQAARVLKPQTIHRPSHNAMIGVGDLVRAIGQLKPADDETLRAIAAALGFETVPPVAVAEEAQTTDRAGVAPRPADFARPRPSAETPSLSPPLPPSNEVVSFEIEKQVMTPPNRPTIKYESLLDGTAQRPPLAPLFRPNWARAIISTALSTEGDHGPLDVEAVVDLVARREPLAILPRLPWPTLRCGVQLLIDRSPALSPFWRDQDHLQQLLVNVVGQDKVHAFTFNGFPLLPDQPDDDRPWGMFPLAAAEESSEAESPALEEQDAYSPPLAGTVVLLLTDLSLGRPLTMSDRPSLQQWLNFAEVVRRAGCPLVACVPYPTKRCPPALRQAIKIIEWDRGTTATAVRMLVGRAHRVGGT
jgi:hypothetical protein